jgi:hypothetical protein
MITAMVVCSLSLDMDGIKADIFAQSSVFEIVNITLDETRILMLNSTESIEQAVTLILVSSICFHCIPSNTDFKSAGKGTVYVLGVASLCVVVAQLVYPEIAIPLIVIAGGIYYLSSLVVPLLVVYLIASMFWVVLLALSLVSRDQTASQHF